MGRCAANIIIETEKELKALLRKEKNKSLLLRLRVGLIIIQHPAMTRNQVAVLMDVNKRTIERWLRNYKQGGLTSYLSLKLKKPKTSKITPEIHEAISAKLKNQENSFRGYGDAQKWIQDELGIFINYQTLRAYMIRHFGKRLKTTRNVLFIKDKHFRDTQVEEVAS